MKWKQARKSTNVRYQSQVHRVRPKQKRSSALSEQVIDAKILARISGRDKRADEIYAKRKRVRLGDR